MDTSFVIVLALLVLFVFMLPTLVRNIDRAASRAALDAVPATAVDITPERARKVTGHVSAGSILRPTSMAGTAFFPQPPKLVNEPCHLQLRAPGPELTLISTAESGGVPTASQPAGGRTALGQPAAHASAHQRTRPCAAAPGNVAHCGVTSPSAAEAVAEVLALPLAAGQSAPIHYLDGSQLSSTHAASGSTQSQSGGASLSSVSAGANLVRSASFPTMNVVNTAMTSQNSHPPRTPAGTTRTPAHTASTARTAAHTAHTARASAYRPGPRSLPAHIRQSAPHGTRPYSAPEPSAADNDVRPPQPQGHSEATTVELQRVGAIIRTLGLLFLVAGAATVITAVLAPFGIVNWAVPLLGLAVMIGDVFVLRTMNLRKLRLRKHGAEAHDDADFQPEYEELRFVSPPEQNHSSASGTSFENHGSGTSRNADETTVPSTTDIAASATKTAGTSAPETVRQAVKDVFVPSAPLDREVLIDTITIDRAAPADAQGDTAEERQPEQGSGASAAGISVNTEAPAVDPFRLRLEAKNQARATSGSVRAEAAEAQPADATTPQANDGSWTPAKLPTPTYVDAPQAQATQQELKPVDAASYELTAQSAEDLAAQFAAELGYRAELADAAREDSPLEHGRNAIKYGRTGTESKVGNLDDVLARRRA